MYAGSLFACNIQQAAYNHSVAVIARDIGKAGEDHSPCVIPCDAHKAGNGQTAEVIAVDIGDARYLYAPHASTHHVGYTGDLNSVHVSTRNSSQNVYSQAVQTVHRREDTEIENVLPTVSVRCVERFFQRERLIPVFLYGQTVACLSGHGLSLPIAGTDR